MSTAPPIPRSDTTARRRGRLVRSRWVIRTYFALQRFRKFIRILEVRYWRKWLVRLYYRRRDDAPPPSALTLRLTNSCNLRCVQCAQWGERGVFKDSRQIRAAEEMTTGEWERLIRRLAPYCPHIYFFGGEPFLRKDLLELVAYASRRNVVTGINTNGNFLSGKGRDLVHSGLDYLMVSLDGPKEVNNRIRVGKLDVFDAVVAGVRELVAAKQAGGSRYPMIEMILTLTEQNQAHVAETAELAWELEVDYFAITFGMFTTPELAAESAAQLRREFGVVSRFYHGFVRDMSRMDARVIEDQIRAVRSRWGSRYKQYPPMPFDVEAFFHRPEAPVVRRPCIAPWLTMQVMSNGEMAFCADFADVVIGNVRTEDPLRLWNNAGSRAWRRRIRTRGIFPAETRCTSYYL